MTERALLRRGEVMEILGISKRTLRKLIDAHVLTEKHFRYGKDGAPLDRALFSREQVQHLVENMHT